MRKRLSVEILRKTYDNERIFLGDLFGQSCPCLFVADDKGTIDKMRRDGLVCVLYDHKSNWHIFPPME